MASEQLNGIEIVIEQKEEKIILGFGVVDSVDFMMDTFEEQVKDRSQDVFNKVMIKGKIANSDVSKELRKIGNWSMATTTDKIYRKVTITVQPGGSFLRKYELPKAFCVDFKETFLTSNTGHSFELLISQRKDDLKDVKINA